MIDHKKALAIIVANRKRPAERHVMNSSHELPEKNEEGGTDPKHAAAQDILHAFHEKSPQRLSEALTAFHHLHALSNTPRPEDDESALAAIS